MDVIIANVVLQANGLAEAAAGRSLVLQLMREGELMAETSVDAATGFGALPLTVPIAVPVVDVQTADGGLAMAAAVQEVCSRLQYRLCAVFAPPLVMEGAEPAPPPALEPLCEGAAEGLGAAAEGPVRGELSGVVNVRLTGYSRVSVQLPSLLAERMPPLALKYAVPANRKELISRQALWREEMCATAIGCSNSGLGASLRWERAPPVKPVRTLGDATTRRLRSERAVEMNEDRVVLSRQAVQREYDARHAALLTCVTALQAHTQLQCMRAYALTGANLAMLDASDALARLRKVRLPFERLVRNVWSAGPETKFDASKASLDKLLEAEAADRAAAEAAIASTGRVPYGPRMLVPQTMHVLGEERKVGKKAEGLGLTTFQGSMRTQAPLTQTKAF